MKLTEEQFDKIINTVWALLESDPPPDKEATKYAIEQILTPTAPHRSADEILKYTKHLPSCNIMADWSEAEDAMRSTPSHLRDNDWDTALYELRQKQNICTCGLEEFVSSM